MKYIVRTILVIVIIASIIPFWIYTALISIYEVDFYKLDKLYQYLMDEIIDTYNPKP